MLRRRTNFLHHGMTRNTANHTRTGVKGPKRYSFA